MVLFRQDSRRGQLVAAASPLAQRDGVQIDMPLAESKSLLARSTRKFNRSKAHGAPHSAGRSGNGLPIHSTHSFHILPHDPTADVLAMQQLADDLDGFSPIIGLQQETDQPDCIFLDVTGLEQLFGNEFKLAAGVENFCHEHGYLPRIAIADTIGLAQGIAQFDWAGLKGSGTNCAKHPLGRSGNWFLTPLTVPLTAPNIQIAFANDDQVHLGLPIEALRLADWINNTLQQLGIRRIGQLLQLPRQDLSARFGDEIHRRLDQLTGRIAEPIIARHRPPEFYAEQLLDYPTSHQETIEVIIERLIGKICAELSAAQQGALQWTIRLYGQHKLPLKLYVSLFQPTATADQVFPLAKMQLDQMLQPNTGRKSRHQSPNRRPGTDSNLKLDGQPIEVTEIAVAVTSCVLLVQRQRKLFDENPRLDRPALAQLINRLVSRLGRQQVVYPAIVAGAQPEQAFQFRPLVNPHRRAPRRTAVKTASPSGSHVMARPLTIFQPAIALETISLSTKQDRSGPATPPALLVYSNSRHSIIAHWGPERIETGWWRGPTVRRDYWRVETETHQQFWIYYDLRKRSWFLQGEF